VALFQRACERDTSQRLLEDDGEADKTEAPPVYAFKAEVYEGRNRLVAHAAKLADGAAGLFADRT
jgi:hypothetical protein